MKKKVTIVGVGPGQERYLTLEAREILVSAKKVYTTARIGMELEGILQEIISFKVSEIISIIRNSDEDMVVMVSGDTGFYSLAQTIAKGIKNPDIELKIVNGLSSMQFFFAQLGSSFENVVLASAHGRKTNLVALANYNSRVFALTGGESKVKDICKELVESDMDFLKITVGEDLGTEHQKIYTASPREVASRDISDLAVILIENDNPTNPNTFIRDEDVERGNAPMTKEEIRHISIAKLNINPTDIVYDIGAGTGSVTLEMAKRANKSTVYAIEQKEDAFELVKLNQKRLGIYNIKLEFGKAPNNMENWEAPDKVFIGGSGKNMGQIIECIVAKHRAIYDSFEDKSKYKGIDSIRFVINTIALESLVEANQLLADKNFENVEYISVSTAKSKKVAGYNMMMANNPIYVISADYKLNFEN